MARERLLEEYTAYPSLLKIYLAAQMYEAFDDLAADEQSLPLNLYERFLAWARSRPSV
ncbi:flavin reductase [Actinoplanes sp. CA-252034]|uniref:flavin reductase n=1 Tax=Actinoplanes sp. CA-252034 TaxID=3239906 RepID=UPI003D97EBEA